MDTLGWVALWCVLCTAECLGVSLVSTHQITEAPFPLSWQPKCLHAAQVQGMGRWAQIFNWLSDLLVENHWSVLKKENSNLLS